MKKKVWILNHYAGNTFFDNGGRHYSLAKYLKRMDYCPAVFCSNTKHGTGEVFFNNSALWQEHISEKISVPFVFIKSVPYCSNGIKRIINMITFCVNLIRTAKEYVKIYGKPDVIYASSVHPLTLVAGLKLAKKFNIKCICEVRDLWPESIVEYSSHLRRNSIIAKVMYYGEKIIYTKADKLIFTMENAYQYIEERNWEIVIPQKKVYYLNNGVDLEDFKINSALYKVEDSDIDNEQFFIIVYTGSIRKVNNLGLLIDGMKHVRNKRVRLLIWGEGDEKEHLEKRLLEENITNVVFKGYIDKKYIPYITQKADANVLHNNPSGLFKYGVSMNKLFDYLAAGRPILADFKSEANPVIMSGAGIECEGNPEEIGRMIDYISEMCEDEVIRFSSNALETARDYSYESLSKKLANIIEEV